MKLAPAKAYKVMENRRHFTYNFRSFFSTTFSKQIKQDVEKNKEEQPVANHDEWDDLSRIVFF